MATVTEQIEVQDFEDRPQFIKRCILTLKRNGADLEQASKICGEKWEKKKSHDRENY